MRIRGTYFIFCYRQLIMHVTISQLAAVVRTKLGRRNNYYLKTAGRVKSVWWNMTKKCLNTQDKKEQRNTKLPTLKNEILDYEELILKILPILKSFLRFFLWSLSWPPANKSFGNKTTHSRITILLIFLIAPMAIISNIDKMSL